MSFVVHGIGRPGFAGALQRHGKSSCSNGNTTHFLLASAQNNTNQTAIVLSTPNRAHRSGQGVDGPINRQYRRCVWNRSNVQEPSGFPTSQCALCQQLYFGGLIHNKRPTEWSGRCGSFRLIPVPTNQLGMIRFQFPTDHRTHRTFQILKSLNQSFLFSRVSRRYNTETDGVPCYCWNPSNAFHFPSVVAKKKYPLLILRIHTSDPLKRTVGLLLAHQTFAVDLRRPRLHLHPNGLGSYNNILSFLCTDGGFPFHLKGGRRSKRFVPCQQALLRKFSRLVLCRYS